MISLNNITQHRCLVLTTSHTTQLPEWQTGDSARNTKTPNKRQPPVPSPSSPRQDSETESCQRNLGWKAKSLGGQMCLSPMLSLTTYQQRGWQD